MLQQVCLWNLPLSLSELCGLYGGHVQDWEITDSVVSIRIKTYLIYLLPILG